MTAKVDLDDLLSSPMEFVSKHPAPSGSDTGISAGSRSQGNSPRGKVGLSKAGAESHAIKDQLQKRMKGFRGQQFERMELQVQIPSATPVAAKSESRGRGGAPDVVVAPSHALETAVATAVLTKNGDAVPQRPQQDKGRDAAAKPAPAEVRA